MEEGEISQIELRGSISEESVRSSASTIPYVDEEPYMIRPLTSISAITIYSSEDEDDHRQLESHHFVPDCSPAPFSESFSEEVPIDDANIGSGVETQEIDVEQGTPTNSVLWRDSEKPTIAHPFKCKKASFSIAASGYFWKTKDLRDYDNISSLGVKFENPSLMQRLKVLRSSIKRIERSKPTSYKKRKFHLNVLANEHDADVESENFFEEEETNEVSQLKLQLVDAGEQIQITQQALGVARHESKEQDEHNAILEAQNLQLQNQLLAMAKRNEETEARNLELQSKVVNLEGEQQQNQKQSAPLGRKRFGELAPSTIKKTRRAIKEKFAEPINTFASNRGLRLEKLVLQDDDGERLEVQVEAEHTYVNLTKGEKRRVTLASRWKDMNRISDRVYASAKSVSYLPPASHVKFYEAELNQQIQEILQVGGNLRGGRVELSPKLAAMVKHQVQMGEIKDGDEIKLKLGGDGTSITKKEQATVHTATLCNSKKALQISCLAIVMGPETYKSIDDTVKELSEEVKVLARNPTYTDPTSGVTIRLSLLWGGDMKYLLMIFGLCSATSNHPCLYCIVGKAHFYKAIFNPNAWREWNAPPFCRTRGSIARERGKLTGSSTTSVKNYPIPPLPLAWDDPIIYSVPPDMMHLETQIGERVVHKFQNASATFTKNKYSPAFVELVRSTNTPFRVAEVLVHGKQKVVFNSLTCRHWRNLLPKLGPLIRSSNAVFAPHHKQPLAAFIEKLVDILEIARSGTKDDAEKLAREANLWVKMFLDLRELGLQGFATSDLTPYMHWMHVHLPFSLGRFGPLNILNGELLEGENADVKETHMRRTHCKDPKQTLQMEKRRELQVMHAKEDHLKKAPRKIHEGPKHQWFSSGIKNRENERRRQEELDRQLAAERQVTEYDNMSVPELKDLIKQLTGKKPRFMDKAQLIDIARANRTVPQDHDDGADYEAVLESLLEQVETETCDAFDDAEFQIAEIFLE